MVVGQTYRFVRFVHDEQEDTVEFTDHTGPLTQVQDDLCTLQDPTDGVVTVPTADVVSLVPPLLWPTLQVQLAPVTCMVIGCGQRLLLAAKATAYGIGFNQLLSMVIEVDLTQNSDDDDDVYQEIVQGSVPSLAAGSHEPSCYNAATVIYNLLAAAPLPSIPGDRGALGPASISGAKTAAGFQGREKPAADDGQSTIQLTTACDGLAAALTTAAGTGNRWVFGINFGIHGFVIAVSGATAEILQSFAGDNGEMLMSFLEKTLTHGRVYTVGQLIGLFYEMIEEGDEDADPGALRAQSILFGGRADEGLTLAPFRWVACQMKTDQAIQQALTAWIQGGISFYDDVKAAKDKAEESDDDSD